MSGHSHAHQRSTPSTLKRVSLRPVRQPLPRALSSPKSAKAGKGKAAVSVIKRDDDDDMASTFLQYCAMCEKQIPVPNNTILYCSESCRRKDSTTSTYAAYSPPPSPVRESPHTAHSIVPLRKPTAVPTQSLKPPMFHDGKSDLDPTEWKPDIAQRPTVSEAYTYLSSFHRSTPDLAANRRPKLEARRNTSALTMSHMAAPSLSHTPVSSSPSSGSSLADEPYSFLRAGLVPKSDVFSRFFPSHNRVKSLGAVGSMASSPIVKGVESASSTSPIIGEFAYEKRGVVGSERIEGVGGSLKKMLTFDSVGM